MFIIYGPCPNGLLLYRIIRIYLDRGPNIEPFIYYDRVQKTDQVRLGECLS